PSAGTAAGSYLVHADVVRDGAVAASAETLFTLTNGATALSGTLALADRSPSWGASIAASYTVRNLTGSVLAHLPVAVHVIDPLTGDVLDSLTATADLAAAGAVSGSASFDSRTLGLGRRLAVLTADLPAAGGATTTVSLGVVAFTVVDRTPPAVAIARPAP